MTQKLLQLSPTEFIPEQVNVSIRTLKDSSVITTTNTLTCVIDCLHTDYVRINLKHDISISFSGATKDGQQIVLALVQDDVVPHTVTYLDSVRLGTDIFSFPVLSIDIGKLDRIIFMYDSVSSKYDLMGYSRGY